MTISEAAAHLGVSAHTLRYYEKLGLVRDVERAGGRRVYTRQDLAWLAFVLRLKATGMPLRDIRRYAELRYAGDSTITARKEMLLALRRDLERGMAKLRGHMLALDEKIAIYEQMEARHDAL